MEAAFPARSGEIDMVELCPSTGVYSNFAGAEPPLGYQVKWPNADGDNFDGQVSMWLVHNGIHHSIQVKMCGADQAAANGGA